MCRHRPTGPWAHVWSYWLAAALLTFGILEGTALATEGSPATLSAYLRQLAGVDARCRHTHTGRAVILAVTGWAAVHLGFGMLGVGGRRRRTG